MTPVAHVQLWLCWESELYSWVTSWMLNKVYVGRLTSYLKLGLRLQWPDKTTNKDVSSRVFKGQPKAKMMVKFVLSASQMRRSFGYGGRFLLSKLYSLV